MNIVIPDAVDDIPLMITTAPEPTLGEKYEGFPAKPFVGIEDHVPLSQTPPPAIGPLPTPRLLDLITCPPPPPEPVAAFLVVVPPEEERKGPLVLPHLKEVVDGTA